MLSRIPCLLCLLLPACATERRATEPEVTTAITESSPAAKPAAQFVAVVTPRISNTVTPDFEGRVMRLFVHSGQHVKAGDVLAELDASDLLVKMHQLDSNAASATAEASASYAIAEEDLRQATVQFRLARFGAAAPEQGRQEQVKARTESERGASASARAKALRIERDDYAQKAAHARLVAPMDGVVTAVKIKEGELAHKGTPIARVVDQHDLLVRFAVPSEQRDTLVLGGRVEVLLAREKRQVFATIERISDELEPPVEYTMVDAALNDTKLDIRVASPGHVRLADAHELVSRP
jgi:multidrug efflux pump subunit AcrA (membrane-fusion protein)